MFGSTFIEAAIGLSLIFLLMSLMCSVICEAIARAWGWRSTSLFEAIDGLVKVKEGLPKEDRLAELVTNHPLVWPLGGLDTFGRRIKPSYLPSSLFARVVLDLLTPSMPASPPAAANQAPVVAAGADQVLTFDPARVVPASAEAIARADAARKAEAAAAKGPAENKQAMLNQLRATLTALIPTLDTMPEDEKIAAIAAWFDAVMERLSGRYKRRSQSTVFTLAFFLTLGLNVDTLKVGNQLQRDKSLRDAVVASATSFTKENKDFGALDPAAAKLTEEPAKMTTSDAHDRLVALQAQLEKLDLPIGWPTADDVKVATAKAKEADKVLEEARDDAAVPASLWLEARADMKASGAALVAAQAPTSNEKTRSDALAAYQAAKTTAAAASADDAAAKKTVAAALLVSEHLNLNLTEMTARTLTFTGPTGSPPVLNALVRFAGWLLTMFAVSLGTRFWFDTLNKLVSIRSGVKPEEKKDDTKGG